MQSQATQSNLALFINTTNQPEVPVNSLVLPGRSNYFDFGVDQKVMPGLDVGVDFYYKMAKDMIDDGQFGQAVVLTNFNWAQGYSEGAEFKVKYRNGNFNAYANFAYQHEGDGARYPTSICSTPRPIRIFSTITTSPTTCSR